MRHKTILKVCNLSVSRKADGKTIKLVRNMDFQLEQGGILGIVGESGSGKEFLPKALLGLLDSKQHVISGEALYLEKDILSMEPRELMKIRGSEIAHVSSNALKALNPHLTIGRQFDILEKHFGSACGSESTDEVLGNLGVEDLKGIRKAYSSGLEEHIAYRVLLAMAVISRPKILIVENPAIDFDGLKKKEILVLLKKISIDYRISIIVETDDFDAARLVCDRVVIMYRGLVVEEGTVNQLMENAGHPYSVGLVKSLEFFAGNSDEMHSLNVEAKGLDESKRRCPFAERCSRSKFYCVEEMPGLAGEGIHKVRCFNPVGGAQ